MKTPFVHLHVHSCYSPLRGVPSLEALCQAVSAQGMDTVALTDTNGLYGAIRFVKVARQAGLKPILGAEVVHGSHRAVLLAKTAEGYANLCRILSDRHCDESFAFLDAIACRRTGLIVLSSDLPALTAWAQDSPQDLYVELTPGPHMHEAVCFSRKQNLPSVATTGAQFLSPSDYLLHQLLRAIALNTTLSRLSSSACCPATRWLMPPAMLERHFVHVPEAVTNTSRIAALCATDWEFKDTIFPAFRRLSAEDGFGLLKKKTYEGAIRRYTSLSPEVRERIEYELRVIREQGYTHYFLIVDEIVRQAPRTCGRGSAAASIVSYCLGITHVDPLRHRLLFERFLNPGRHDPPDIDIDFPWDERDAVFHWVFTRYRNSAAMVANQNTLAFRAAIREVAKVHGIAPSEIGRILPVILRRLIPAEDELISSWTAKWCHQVCLQTPWPTILEQAGQLTGHFRNLGLHCGGIVLVPDDIRRYVPMEISAKGLPVIQWEKDQSEDAGLVKIDLLGNRSLAVIRDALAAVARHTGCRLDYETWNPLDDDRTKALIRQGDTMGCFYIESPATRLLLKKLWRGMPPARGAQVDDFEYLTIVSSLVRPAAHTFVNEFLRRAHGRPYEPLHPLLTGVLDETFGILVYQEDVMKVAMVLGGFTVEEGDQLRKVLTKKHRERRLHDFQRQFHDGAKARGVSAATIQQIWAMIMSFAGYSFCKPHSASYAQVSFKCAYLRAHHPAEFMAAVISNLGGFYSTYAYLSEARRMGLSILPPDINASDWAYTGTGRRIRMGLMQLKGLQRTWAENIVMERQNGGPFQSLREFLERVPPEQDQTCRLIKAGCFDSVAGELTRPALLWQLLAWQKGDDRCYLPIPPEYSQDQQLAHEIEGFGFPLRAHPLDLPRHEGDRMPRVFARDMGQYVGRPVVMGGVLLTEKIVHTKHGDPMEFVTFEDQTALYDAAVFPALYRQSSHLLAPDHAYLVKGFVQQQFLTVTLTVQQIRCLDRKLTAAVG